MLHQDLARDLTSPASQRLPLRPRPYLEKGINGMGMAWHGMAKEGPLFARLPHHGRH